MKRRIRQSRRLRAALGGVLGAGALVGGVGVKEAEAVTFIKSDLDFMLQQIKISEAHAGGGELLGTGPLQVSNPLFPYGVRTVDGRLNNLLPGQSEFGAADTQFLRLTSPLFREGELLTIDPDGPGNGQAVGDTTNYNQTRGFVQDSAPRRISNLISDSTKDNPAAVAAATARDGSVATNEVQTLSGSASAPFQITFNGQTTTSLSPTATAANIESALVALSNVEPADITVTGGPLPGVVTIAFQGAFAGENIPQITVSVAELTGATVATSTGGAAEIPEVPAVNEVQTISGTPTADYTLTFGADTTASILSTATAADVQAALEALPGIGAGNVAVTDGPPPATFTVTFQGTLAGTNVAELSSNSLDLTIATATEGAAAVAAVPAVNEVQRISGTPSASFRITFDGQTTAALDPTVDAAAVQTALEALSNIAPGDVAVAGSLPGGIDITFQGALAGTNVAEITLTAAAVTGVRATTTHTGGDFFIPNSAPDEGLSAPYNSWFTFFGQFFDHGLDLLNKGGNGTVFMPLKADDPLIPGPDGILGNADDLPPHRRFMVVTRATNRPGGGVDNPATPLINESLVHEHTNQTTPFVDQNQTYTSHPSHQVFLREYELDGTGRPVATGRLLDRPDPAGGLARWEDVKAQAATMLGIQLSDVDILNLPRLVTDQYGKFIPDPDTGFAQIATTTLGAVVVGNPAGGGVPVPANAIRTRHAFLDDIAHTAVPSGDLDGNPATPGRGPLSADLDTEIGIVTPNPDATVDYDDELLGAHFITGDGRGNENIGLTSVHHVFHAEHNRLATHIQEVIVDSANLAFLNEWLLTPAAAIPAGMDPAARAAFIASLTWNGERLFQAARFGTEMQYQHLVFEEFARKVQPEVNIFAGYHTDINPAIVAEFAHAVYRFGHSMLTETVPRVNADGSRNDVGLIEAFLNPVAFNDDGDGNPSTSLTAREAAGSVAAGTTRDVGNEIDEFVTGALRNNLLGLPLDLPAINLGRARDTGIPSLNAARREFFAASAHPGLTPYENWSDFELSLKNPASLVNFIAAYGKHGDIVSKTTMADKRAVAKAIVTGAGQTLSDLTVYNPPADRLDFLNSTGLWTTTEGTLDSDGFTRTGLGDVDLWIGGLAEKQMPFGGLLGSTFNYVFEGQMERLQDGDRFYYLGRLAGLNFLTELEGNSFAAIIQKNTDGLVHPPADVFSRPDFIIEAGNTPHLADDPDTVEDESALVITQPNGTIRFIGGQHVVMGGTAGNDRMRAGIGDDTLHGDAGDDRLEGEAGNDVLLGGEGDDILTDLFGIDNIKGGPGNDAISAGTGTGDLTLAGAGKDFVVQGTDEKEAFLGTGDDFINGSDGIDTIFGDEGDDWIEGGNQSDLLQGGNGAPFQDDAGTGNDVIDGGGGNDDYDSESGDDILIAGIGTERMEGMRGYDWVTHFNDPLPANSDMNFTGLQPPDEDNVRDRFDDVEGLSGWNKNDILRGDNGVPDAGDPALQDLTNPGLITDLGGVIGGAPTVAGTRNILIGGGGSDIIEGRGGDDIIDGDAYLDVHLTPDGGVTKFDGMSKPPTGGGQTLQQRVFAGTLNPGNITIVREIHTSEEGVDTAVFSGPRADYDFTLDATSTTLLTITHARNNLRVNDGTDTLRNIDRLQFSDQIVDINLTLTNVLPTGSVTISDTTPTEDQLLTASAVGVTDADGLTGAVFTFTWQAEEPAGVWTTVGTGETFTPGDLQVEAPLRVVLSFTDDGGVFEQIMSAVTAPVENINDPATGAPVINDTTPAQGQLLTASLGTIDDADTLLDSLFSFQWQQFDPVANPLADPNNPANNGLWVNVGTPSAGALAPVTNSFTPGAAQVGMQLRVVVSFLDHLEGAESRASLATAAVTAPGVPLFAPLTLGRAATAATITSRAVVARGVQVAITAPARTQVLRVRVFKQGKSKPAATVFMKAKQGKALLKLRHGAIVRVLKRGGTFRLELTPGVSRSELGSSTWRKITVRKR